MSAFGRFLGAPPLEPGRGVERPDLGSEAVLFCLDRVGRDSDSLVTAAPVDWRGVGLVAGAAAGLEAGLGAGAAAGFVGLACAGVYLVVRRLMLGLWTQP
jgi:hypothetical protein